MATIADYETLHDFIGQDGKPRFSTMKEQVDMFRKRLCELQEMGKKKHISAPDLLVLINRQYGYIWRSIPWGMFGEILEWVKANWYRNFQILEPEKHNTLMKSENDYSSWFRYEEAAHNKTTNLTTVYRG